MRPSDVADLISLGGEARTGEEARTFRLSNVDDRLLFDIEEDYRSGDVGGRGIGVVLQDRYE